MNAADKAGGSICRKRQIDIRFLKEIAASPGDRCPVCSQWNQVLTLSDRRTPGERPERRHREYAEFIGLGKACKPAAVNLEEENTRGKNLRDRLENEI